ncbi:MAG: hypothetical protein K0U84_20275 [Actinomycetia bacterium]|nr:hypothetical protein [Actinomycetes bacterium]
MTDTLRRCSDWIRAWSPATVLGWCGRHRRITAGIVVAVVVMVFGASRAAAEPLDGSAVVVGGVLTSWMGVTDSDGVPVAKYTLSLNEGGWNDPISTMFARLASISYEIYRDVVTTALWLIRYVLDFGWMDLFTAPFKVIGGGVESAMAQFGLAAAALAVLGIVVVWTTLAGKTAKAVSNIAMGMLMIGLAATIFANPLSQLIGSDGLLAKGRDTGLQIANTVSGGTMKQTGGGANVDDIVSQLADRFLRQPTQMINFGQVADSVSRQCRQAWTDGIKDERGDKLKDDIKGCDSVKGLSMHQKSMGNPAAVLVPLYICGFLALFLVAFAGFFAWHVVRAAVQALLYAALAPPAFAIGVIPGGPQTFAWKTVLDAVMAFTAMVIYTAGFGAYNLILDHVFAQSGNAIQSLFYTALVLAFGFAVFGPLRRMFDRQRDIGAAKLSSGGTGGGHRSGLFQKTAELALLRQEARHLFGGHKGGSHGGSQGGHGPARLHHEAEMANPHGGGHHSAGRDGHGGPGRPPETDRPAAGGGAGPSSASGPAEAAPTPNSGGGGGGSGHTQPQPRQGENSRIRDNLAAAMQIYKARHGGPAAGGSPGAGRHALSEVA